MFYRYNNNFSDSLIIFDFSPSEYFGNVSERDVIAMEKSIKSVLNSDTLIVTKDLEKPLKSSVTPEMVSSLEDIITNYKYVLFSGLVMAEYILTEKHASSPSYVITDSELSQSDARNRLRMAINTKITVNSAYVVKVPGPVADTEQLRQRIQTIVGGTVKLFQAKTVYKPLYTKQKNAMYTVTELNGVRYGFTEGPKFWQSYFWENMYSILAYDLQFVRCAKEFDSVGITSVEFTGTVDDMKNIVSSVGLTCKNPIAIDIESTGLQPWKKVDLSNRRSPSPIGDFEADAACTDHTIISMSVSFDGKTGYSFCVQHPQYASTEGLALLKYICGMPNAKIIQNGKFEFRWLEMYYGVTINGKIIDTQINEHLIDENLGKGTSRYSLAGLIARRLMVVPYKDTYLSETETGLPKVKLTGKSDLPDSTVNELWRLSSSQLAEYREKDFTKMNNANLHTYGGYDAAATYLVFRQQVLEMKRRGMGNAYKRITFDLQDRMVRALGTMESTGMPVSGQGVLDIIHMCDGIAEEKEDELINRYGANTRFSSNKEITAMLKEHEPVLSEKLPKTKKGDFKLDKEIVDIYSEEYPFLRTLSDYKHARKARGTYMVPFLQYACNSRVHFEFVITGTFTGRLASRNPNMQNVPHHIEKIAVKSVLKPEAGMPLFNIDLATAELKILALYSRDENMLRVINEGGDLHSYTAAAISGEPYEAILEAKMASNKTAEHRRLLGYRQKSKRVNFGIVFGITPKALAKQINVGEDEAAEYMERYFEQYPGVAQFLGMCRDSVKQKGYIETIFGRRRNFPMGQSRITPRHAIGRMERQSMNFIIQSTTSDWFQYLIYDLVQVPGIIPHITVHDSLVFSMDETETTFRRVKESFDRILIDKPKQLWPEFMIADVGYDFTVGPDYGSQLELSADHMNSLSEANDYGMPVLEWYGKVTTAVTA